MEDTTIWRYLDFTKFADLLDSQSLFFCRSDKFGDVFEGSYPTKAVERRKEELAKDGIKADELEQELLKYSVVGENFRKYVFINCWHISEYESAAMWKTYLKSDEGVAIKSSRGRLGSAVAKSEYGVWSVPVKYVDYMNDDVVVPTRWAPFRYKRKSFEHERELRAMIFSDVTDEVGKVIESPSEYGLSVKADLNTLIDEIYVSPTAAAWFFQLVRNLAQKYELDKPVIQSSLKSEKPLFV
jgi:hypothetical protein